MDSNDPVTSAKRIIYERERARIEIIAKAKELVARKEDA